MAVSSYNILANIRDDQKFPPKGFSSTSYPREANVTVTAAQILAAYTTPVTLIPAPAEDTYIVIDEIVAFHDYGTATYAGAGVISIRYTDGSGAKVVNDLAEVAFLEATEDTYAMRKGIDVTPACAAIVMYADTGNPTTGDGQFKFNIKYRIVAFS